jgi:hypothetical protein
MLAEIAEQPEFDDADRSIGNYDFHDEEWDSWKAGPVECEDEFDSEDDDDETSAKHKSVLGYLISLNGFLTAIKSTKGVKALVLP